MEIMEPPTIIGIVKADIRKYGKNIVNNVNIPIEYMEGPYYGYSWSDYFTREYLPEVTE